MPTPESGHGVAYLDFALVCTVTCVVNELTLGPPGQCGNFAPASRVSATKERAWPERGVIGVRNKKAPEAISLRGAGLAGVRGRTRTLTTRLMLEAVERV
ncbi:hypothetical protein GCM10029976_010010 [Kribbella albertanoniae]